MLNVIKRSPSLYAAGRKARFALGSRLGARPVAGIGRAHYNDFMLTSTAPDRVASYTPATGRAPRREPSAKRALRPAA
jgi:hypothetical protein